MLNSDEDCAKLTLCGAQQSHALTALLVCYDKSKVWVCGTDGTNSGYVDTAIVETHMMLAAEEKEIGTVWGMAV